MRNKGVKGLYWVGEPTNLSKLLSEAASLDITFDWVLTDANHYDPQVTSIGDAADGTYVRTAFYPFLDPEAEAEKNPATAAVPRPDRAVRPGRQDRQPRRPGSVGAGCCSPRPRTSAAPSSPATACGRRRRRSPSGPAAGCTRRRTSKTGDASNCFALLKVEGGEFVLDDGIEPTEQHLQLRRRQRCRRSTGDYGTGAKCPNPAYADRSEAVELFVTEPRARPERPGPRRA